MGLRTIFTRRGTYDLLYPMDDGIPDDEKIVLKMRYLTYKERERLANLELRYQEPEVKDGKVIRTPGEERFVIQKTNALKDNTAKIKCAVTGWERVKDEEGKPVKFSMDDLLNIRKLEWDMPDGTTKDFDFRIDLLRHIDKENDLSLEEEGE